MKIALIIFVGLVVFFYLFARKGKKKKGESERIAKLVGKLSTDEGGSWYLQKARQHDGDEKILEIILKEK